MKNLTALLKKRVLILNGATGTNLLDKGLSPGESPSMLNLKNPEAVYGIHKAYCDAGADIILTNTFSANPLNIPSRQLRSVITRGVELAQKAARGRAFIFGDVGPLGELVRPYGELDFAEAKNIFKTLCGALHRAGTKVFFLETFTSILEAKAAFLAARIFSDTVYVCLSLQENGRTIMGDIPESIAIVFEKLGARAVGINCTAPDIALEALRKMKDVTHLPLIAKPNAGRIRIVGNRVHHSLSDAVTAQYFDDFVRAGANIVGGCCGTTPEYVRRIAQKQRTPVKRTVIQGFSLTSPSSIVRVNDDTVCVVGERLNPSGRKSVKQSLRKRSYKIYGEEARLQEAAGADALDVNAFDALLDERVTLREAVYEVVKNSRCPLFIDTQNLDAARRVLEFYPGIGVLNSIPARTQELVKWLPLVKQYGFKAVISLVGTKIPRSVEERMNNAALALRIARRMRFPCEDLIFDPLVYALAIEPKQIDYTLKTVALLRKKGLKTILGISNVSFGLPNRAHLNAALAGAAMQSGATFIILNPLDQVVMNTVHAAGALHEGASYLRKQDRSVQRVTAPIRNLNDAILYGDVTASLNHAGKLLKAGVPANKIIDKYIAQSLERVGDYYERGKFYIPDLLKAAEASQAVLGLIRQFLPKGRTRGTVVLATVKGDIHDVGKNIAAMIFESAGYGVIDLGKNVSAQTIVKAVKKNKPDALGLSALLTTTMPEMGHVIKALQREKLNVKVIIGGPNVTTAYAKKIGAYGAAQNVLQGLKFLKTMR